MKVKGLFIVVAIMLFVIGGCSNDKANSNEGKSNQEDLDNVAEKGMPIVDDSISLDVFAARNPQTAEDWNDILLFTEFEERSNVTINWQMVPSASAGEKKNLSLASNDQPDAYYAGMSDSEIVKYGEQGVFIRLNELIDDYAPNLKKIMEENPEVEKALTMPDGSIYSFPRLMDPDFTSMRMSAKPFINKEWLETLGMDMPETTDQLYKYLKVVKQEDPGNNDGVPYGAPNITVFLDWLKGSFGIGNKGFRNPYFDLDPETEKVRFIPTTNEYKEMLEYVNKLYEEELINQDIFSTEIDKFLANASDGLYGSTNWYSPIEIFGEEAGGAYTGAPALEGPHGEKKFAGLQHPVATKAMFTITSANENPAATVRWIDYFYGDEGAKLFFMGVDGETFEETDDGDFEFMDHITNSEEGLTFEQEAAKYLIFPGGDAPAFYTKDYFKGAESFPQELEAAEKIEDNLIDEAWPTFSYTVEENKGMSSFGSDIEKYVDEMQDKFIVGDIPFSEWKEYVETIEDMGLSDYMKTQNAAYKRYSEGLD